MGSSMTIVAQRLRARAPSLLLTSGVTGLVASNILSGIAGFKAAKLLDENPPPEGLDEKELRKYQVSVIWKEFLPPTLATALTAGSIVGGARLQNHRLDVATAAYAGTQKAFDRYRKHVVEEIGTNRQNAIEDAIRTEIADEVDHRHSLAGEDGKVLCLELHTGRYFYSTMETLRKAQNDVNHEVVNTLYGTLDYFYDRVGLGSTSGSSDLGWDSDRLLELKFTTLLHPDGVPTLAFDYNYLKPV